MEYVKNDLVTVTIDDMGADGEGIGKVDGFTLFVKDAVIGDTVEAKILKNKKHYAYAKVEKVVKPSPFRAQPECRYHKQCGGCQIQALSYEKQLEFKEKKVRNNLIRIGGFEEAFLDRIMEPIVGMENPYHYRNKAQYPVGTDKNGDVITGFYAGRTHSIIANTDCALGHPQNEEILNKILTYMKKNKVSAYNEETEQGLVRHILIRTGFTSKEIMVCLIINKKPAKLSYQAKGIQKQNNEFLPAQDKLLQELAAIDGMTSVSVSINTEKTNVIMGKEVHCIWGSSTIQDTIHVRDMQKDNYPFTGQELTFKISPLSFYQVNPVQTEKLYSLALEYAGLTGRETVWDLYCGIGTISLFLATKAKQVYGVEIVPQAIEDARENAQRNGITNAGFFVGKAEEVLPRKYKEEGIYADVIVVDPPRKGCDEACLSTMLQMQPERIVYVSCDSATLARDLKVLCDGGYAIKKVRPVDQFGQTVHVETVALLSRKIDVHKMKLNSTPFEMIKSGEKTIELRLFDEKRQKIKVGDKIVFTDNTTGETLNTTVVKLHRFNTFNELYKSLPLLKCGYTTENVDKATPADMEQYYSVEEQKKYGVVGIELFRPKQITDETVCLLERKGR